MVPQHEVVVYRHTLRGERVHGPLTDIWLGETLSIHEDVAVAHFDDFTGQTDDPCDDADFLPARNSLIEGDDVSS